MQSLCTLRNHCRQRSRNTRYQAGAAPYLDRSSTGWIAPACLAHSFDHLVGPHQQRRRHVEAERLGGLEVDNRFIFGRRLHWEISWISAAQDAIDVGCRLPILLDDVGAVG